MLIAKAKRRENIAEYILYLWQLEDLLRALEFSPEKIYHHLVEPHHEMDAAAQQYLLNWYMDMINILVTEGKQSHGHMEHTLHLLADLNDLHSHLLKAPVGKEYVALFAPLSAELAKLRSKITAENVNDIELCFMALYSVILCRMKGDTNKQYITDVMDLISPVIAKLSQIHIAAERGEIDLYKEE